MTYKPWSLYFVRVNDESLHFPVRFLDWLLTSHKSESVFSPFVVCPQSQTPSEAPFFSIWYFQRSGVPSFSLFNWRILRRMLSKLEGYRSYGRYDLASEVAVFWTAELCTSKSPYIALYAPSPVVYTNAQIVLFLLKLLASNHLISTSSTHHAFISPKKKGGNPWLLAESERP